MSDRLTLPVLPLREVVLFPGVTTQIGAGRPGTLKAIEAALKGPDKLVFAVSQLENLESVSPDNLYEIGTIARIGQLQRGLSGMQLLLHGEQRGVCVHYEDRDGHLVAVVRPVDEMQPLDAQDPAFIAMHREVRARAAELGQKSGLPEEVVRQVLEGVDDPGRFADLVAGYIEITSAQRQALLQTFSVEERLRRVLVHVQRQIGVADAQEQIKADVQEELGERQKEMFLREQLKQIRRQLGDEDQESDLDELRDKLAMLELDEVVRKEVDRELGRLERVNKDSTEAQVIRTFLETVAELPWNVRSEEKLELAAAQQILDADHYALGDVKDRVLEFLAVRQLRAEKALQATAAKAEATEAIAAQENEGSATPEPASATAQREIEDVLVAETAEARKEAKGPILLFIGPPGVGKTSVAKSIARAMGRKYVRISLGGARDEADIRGHRRTYVGAMPGRIIQGLKQAGTKNPVFLLDEIDKLGVSYQGDPSSALLEVLDPAQNDAFVDHYLGIPFDLSEVLFVATANFIQNIPGPLLDRMELVDFSSYTEREKKAIARTYLLPRQMEENGVDEARFEINDEALATLISGYTREAGVRQLERELGKVARKVARRLAAKEVTRVAVTPADLGTMLGRPRVHPEQAARADEIGVATGMYYTPVGGDIMFVEASTMRGKGELVLTGQLGDVMKESARAAWTYARAHALGLRIPDDMFERDLHIHVPAGAIPKDGPSAGVAMATTIVSALSGRPVRHDIAMTGEITLRGTVLPIGGVKEKILGAVRAGITKVILPKDNERDLDDLPREVRDMLEIHLVSDLGDALARTLRGASYREGRLLFGDEKPADVSPLQTAYH